MLPMLVMVLLVLPLVVSPLVLLAAAAAVVSAVSVLWSMQLARPVLIAGLCVCARARAHTHAHECVVARRGRHPRPVALAANITVRCV